MTKTAALLGTFLILATRAAAFTMTVDSCSGAAGTYAFTVGNPDSPSALCSIGIVFHGFGSVPIPYVDTCTPPTGWSCQKTVDGGVRYAASGGCLALGGVLHGIAFHVGGSMGPCIDTTIEFAGSGGQVLSSRRVCLACGPVSDVPEVGKTTWHQVKGLYRN